METYNGNFDASGKKWAIIVSRTNEFISERLLSGSADCLARHGAEEKDVDVIRVPGAFELPLAAKMCAGKGVYSAVICLGAVIRGATSHHEYIASEAAKGIAQVSLSSGIPVSFGVLTTESIEQAIERAGTKSGNKGWEAAMCAIEMANLASVLESRG